MQQLWSVVWRVLTVILVLAVTIEGVNTGLWLMNQPDDLAVLMGVLAIVASLLLCGTGAWGVLHIYRTGKQESV